MPNLNHVYEVSVAIAWLKNKPAGTSVVFVLSGGYRTTVDQVARMLNGISVNVTRIPNLSEDPRSGIFLVSKA